MHSSSYYDWLGGIGIVYELPRAVTRNFLAPFRQFPPRSSSAYLRNSFSRYPSLLKVLEGRQASAFLDETTRLAKLLSGLRSMPDIREPTRTLGPPNQEPG